MRGLFTNHFEATWRAIFLTLFIGIMLPIRCFVNHEYDPGLFGVPNFIWNWLVYGVITYALIVVYYKMSMKRPENHRYDDKGEN
ncbi:hypothetical protein [Sediminispirochaeta smaragdinae]|uniref:DUF3311 domain-containing protein n=1 Tax=Sediminispirochaeta smaragdinae (strain DSM 11293 / JCM 15392 / SEBR 4228) TaxID=573413 RepID=E1R4N0_SEDSS|nr:hypothetical protein [Sediminispirochaeta smaragdinae]ADK82118.1 conserved hypothetical protein [Sediminispirochaeta smaragdinae DSM 11293]